jgi:acyl-lipid omega-6 desaturase (Delta-12 desaturase)
MPEDARVSRPRRIQSRPDLVRALLPYARPDTRLGALRFAGDYALFLLGTALALLASNVPLRVLGAVLAGMKMSSLYAVAHDAAHNTLTASRRLNKILGAWAYLTGFYNYRLRLYDHLLRHHPLVNGPQPDAYRPMSLAQYRALPAWRRGWERFIRSANPLAWCAYGMAARLMKSETFPKKSMPAAVRRQAWAYAALMFTYVGGGITAVAWYSGFGASTTAINLFYVLVLPFLAFQANQAIVVYFQHTDPRVPWFARDDLRHMEHGAEQLSVHLALPRWLSTFVHHMFCHAAHHVCPSVPCYRLYDAQRELDALLGERSVVIPFRLGAMLDVFRRCKLYDYEQHRWLDFDGNPTSDVLVAHSRSANGSQFSPLMADAA